MSSRTWSSPLLADRPLLISLVVLLGVSLLMVFSTTAVLSNEMYGDAGRMAKLHLIHITVGLVVFVFFALLNPRILCKLSQPLLFGALLLLLITLLPGVGTVAGGARRWLSLGPFRLQPGELAKLLVVIYFASYIGRNRTRMYQLQAGVLIPLGILCAVAVLLLCQPDFGTTVVIFGVVFMQLFTAARLLHIAGAGAISAAALALLVYISPYRFRRFIAFLDPFSDPSASGYQLIQSLIAVGSGGLIGSGLGAGKQKLFYLPAAHTDFIFAVIAEELGIFGATLVLALFLLILYRGLLIAMRLAEDPFLSSLALGCTLLTVLPALLNMGVVLGLLPTKGLVLPLVAYGGTAMVVHLAAAGMLLRLSRMEP